MTILFKEQKISSGHEKKNGCSVICSTKKIFSFPEFKIPHHTRNNKDEASKFIKTFLNNLKGAKDKKIQ